VLLFVPPILFGLLACGWVLTRSQWSWWVRVPGCIVIYPVAALVGMVALLGLGIGMAWVVIGIQWVIDRLPG